MSQEQLMQFQQLLAYHAAPTLMGVKCGSLIRFSSHEYAENADRINSDKLDTRVIYCSDGRCLLYIYDKKLLAGLLECPGIRRFLAQQGYEEGSIPSYLDTLCERLISGSFPHEIGVFLGYPLEDVEGFIENCGKGCKLCGCWKVYSDVKRAKMLFETYRRCREQLCRQLKEGKTLCSFAA